MMVSVEKQTITCGSALTLVVYDVRMKHSARVELSATEASEIALVLRNRRSSVYVGDSLLIKWVGRLAMVAAGDCVASRADARLTESQAETLADHLAQGQTCCGLDRMRKRADDNLRSVFG